MPKTKVKRLNRWKSEWLARTDNSGDKLGEYIVKVDDLNSRCTWCKLNLFHGSSGLSSLLQHANKLAIHKTNADLRKNRNRNQMRFVTPEDVANNNNPEEEPAADVEIEDETRNDEDSAGEVGNNAIPVTRNNPGRDRTIVLQVLDGHS